MFNSYLYVLGVLVVFNIILCLDKRFLLSKEFFYD